jgi:phage terminase large subunit GpA-like protein
MSEKYIDFAGERDPKLIEEQDLARYVFPCCGLVGNDRVRIAALQLGVWHERLSEKEEKEGVKPRRIEVCLREMKPRKICFHSPGVISPLFFNSAIAAAFLRGMKDPEAMHYYDNQVRAIAHVPFRQNRKIDNILALRDERPAGLVPGGGQVSALTAGVDTQTGNFVFSIRAFGWGLIQPSWQIRHGEVDTFEALIKVLFEDQYMDSNGLYYPVHLAVMDTGGDRTSDVYDFCRMHPGRIIAYKGASGRKANPKTKTVIDTYPNTKTPIPGGLDLWICDSHHYKDQLAGKLKIKKDDPGAYLLSKDTTEEFAIQMCAEYVDSKRMWQCPKGKANHYWDTSVMELVGADMLQLKFQANPNGPANQQKEGEGK